MYESRNRPILSRMIFTDRPLDVVVATGRPATRAALTALLESEPRLRAAGVAGDLPTAVRLIRATDPDAMLIDRTVLGPGDGRLRMLAASMPGVAVFLVGMGDHPRLDANARDAGAAGYIRLDEAPERLSGALVSRLAA
jgi:DNA-binding NarL/FixJ family response regulator